MACLDNIKRPDIQFLTEDENEFEEHIQKIRYPLTLCYKHTHDRHIKAIICRGTDTTVFCMMWLTVHDGRGSARFFGGLSATNIVGRRAHPACKERTKSALPEGLYKNAANKQWSFEATDIFKKSTSSETRKTRICHFQAIASIGSYWSIREKVLKMWTLRHWLSTIRSNRKCCIYTKHVQQLRWKRQTTKLCLCTILL